MDKNGNTNKKLSELPMNSENPFLKQALAKLGNALVSKKVLGANRDEGAILKAVDGDGQILGNTVFMRNKTVDQEHFYKFFDQGFKAFFDLKPASIKVFHYLISLLKPNTDEVVFLVDECKKATGCGTTTIYRSLTELCNAEIIARGKSDFLYYINPMVVFNGDRVTFATTWINSNYPKYHTTSGSLKGTIDVMKSDSVLPQPTLDLFEEESAED